jgi:hypothetical protein
MEIKGCHERIDIPSFFWLDPSYAVCQGWFPSSIYCIQRLSRDRTQAQGDPWFRTLFRLLRLILNQGCLGVYDRSTNRVTFPPNIQIPMFVGNNSRRSSNERSAYMFKKGLYTNDCSKEGGSKRQLTPVRRKIVHPAVIRSAIR